MELIAGSKLCGMCMFFPFLGMLQILKLYCLMEMLFLKSCAYQRDCVFMLDFHIHKFDRQVKYMCACAYGGVFLHVYIDKDYRILTLKCGSYTLPSVQVLDLLI